MKFLNKNNKLFLSLLIFFYLSFIFIFSSVIGSGFTIDNTIGGNTANPASVFCVNHNGTSKIIDGKGYCYFKDGSYCTEWDYYYGKCKPGDNKASNIDKVNSKYILFAHGMGDDTRDWDVFAKYARDKGYKVFMTNVSRCGSVNERAKQLAEYINKLDIPDDSLKVVCHSMAGIDIRYLVGEAHNKVNPFYDAAKKIDEVFTLGSPHGGSQPLESASDIHFCALKVAGKCIVHFDYSFKDEAKYLSACGPETAAWKNLTNDGVARLNKEFPYSDFSVDGRKIGFLAFAFECPMCGGFSDCVVGTNSQTWKGAPSYHKVFEGVHSVDVHNNVCNVWHNSINLACNGQCDLCNCWTVNKGPIHFTVCPPKRDVCLDICHTCRNVANDCPMCKPELEQTNVLNIILNFPLHDTFSEYNQVNEVKATFNNGLVGAELPSKEGNKFNGSNNFSNKNMLGKVMNINETDFNEFNNYLKKYNFSWNGSNFNKSQMLNSTYNETGMLRNKTKKNMLGKSKEVSNNINKVQNEVVKRVNNSMNSINKKIKNEMKFVVREENGKVMNVSLKQLKNRTELNFNLGSKNLTLHVNSNVKINNNSILLVKNNKTYEVKITPNKIYTKFDNLKNEVGDLNIQNVSLNLENGKPVYNISVKTKAKILWLFPTTLNENIIVNAENGKVEQKTETPWYITFNPLKELNIFN